MLMDTHEAVDVCDTKKCYRMLFIFLLTLPNITHLMQQAISRNNDDAVPLWE